MIRPLAHYPDGSVDVVFDETGHTGRATPAMLTFVNRALIALACPDGCGAVTYHPIQGDGTCRALVQEMFARQVKLKGCPCGASTIGKPFPIVVAHLRSHLTQEGGNWEQQGALV